MNGSEFLKIVKEAKKRMKKFGRQHWKMLIGTVFGLLSMFVFPENLFILLKNALATILPASWASFGAVAAQIAGMVLGFGGAIVNSWKAGNSRNFIESKIDDLSTGAITAFEKVTELEKQLEKEKANNKDLRDQLQQIKSEERVNRNTNERSDTYENTDDKQRRK